MKLEIFGHTRMHFNHLSRASIVVRFHLPAGAAGRVACTPLASPLSLPLSPCLSLFLTVAALLSALNEFYSCVGVEAHDKCDERIKRKTPHSFSCPPSSATHTPPLSLSLSLHLTFFRCTWAHVVCCSKLSIRHGVRHCRSCLAISQLPPCLTISTSTSACLPPSLTASSLSLSLPIAALALIIVIRKFSGSAELAFKTFQLFQFSHSVPLPVGLSVRPVCLSAYQPFCLSVCLAVCV